MNSPAETAVIRPRLGTAAIAFYLALTSLALAGAFILHYAQFWGPGVGGDATIYIVSARNLLAGHGLGLIGPEGEFRILPYFPPLYPLLLAFFGLFGADLVEVARWLNIALFAGLVFLSGWTVYHFTRSRFWSIFLAYLILVSPVLINIHAWAMSEPVSLLAGLAGLVLVMLYLEQPSRLRLVWAGVLCGAALLARYAGVAYLLAGGLALLLFSSRHWRQRLLDGVWFGLIAALPMAVWLVVDYAVSGTVASRSSLPAGEVLARIWSVGRPLREVILGWVPYSATLFERVPDSLHPVLWLVPALLLAGLFGGLLWWARRRHGWGGLRQPAVQLLLMSALFVAVYLLVVAVVFATTYPPITLADRMFAPAHLVGLIFLAALFAAVLQAWPRQVWLGLLFAVVLGVVALSYTSRSRLQVAELNHNGLGYTGAYWRDSALIDAVLALPPDQPIVTNETTALLFLADRRAYTFSEIYLSEPLTTFTRYGSDLSDTGQRAFREQGAALVLFNTIHADLAELYGERTEERFQILVDGLEPAFQAWDGTIYYYTPPAP